MRSNIDKKGTTKALKEKISFSWHRSDEVKREPWFIHRWEVFFVFGIVGVLLVINMLPEWVTTERKNLLGGSGEYHPLFSHPLKHNKIYQNVSIVLTIVLSLWMTFFTEMGKYLGKYGSAIFIMMPSFLWLLSDRYGDNMIKAIFEAESNIAWITFWGFISIFVLFLIKITFKFILYQFKDNSRNRYTEWRIEFASSLINRIFFMLLNFAAIFIVASRLMTYGSYTLGLVAEEKGVNHTSASGMLDKYVYFIAIIAVAASFLLVLVGLLQKFEWKAQKEIVEKSLKQTEVDTSLEKELNKKYLSLDRALKTRVIKLNEANEGNNAKTNINELTVEINVLKKELKKAKKIKEKIKKRGGV